MKKDDLNWEQKQAIENKNISQKLREHYKDIGKKI